MELSRRLQAVADLLSGGLRIADIGCDHGFLSIYLVQTRKASGCIAMDVNRGPLERAEENVDRQGLSTYIETRLSDGAKALRSGETEAAVLAGMGGRLMIRIIEDSLEKFLEMKEFVLQPQSEIAGVRRFVRRIDCVITAEDIVLEDGKFYPMMKVERKMVKEAEKAEERGSLPEEQRGSLSETQELFDTFGEFLLKGRHPVLKQFLEKEKKQQEGVLLQLKQQASQRSKKRAEEIEKELEKIQQGLEWF